MLLVFLVRLSLHTGEILELGPGVEGFKVGQKVVTMVRIGPSILLPTIADLCSSLWCVAGIFPHAGVDVLAL
jgi:hypothetical protein